MMKERPILFSGEMVRAILEGQKTQTRRVIKVALDPLSSEPAAAVYPARESGWIPWWPDDYPGLAEFTKRVYKTGNLCPYGVPGDRLWVRESYRLPEYYTTIPKGEWVERKGRIPVLYESTGDVIAPGPPPHSGSVAFGKLHPSIFMPRWASRITLEITNVRVERVQEITFDDAIAEGVFVDFDPPDGHGFRSEAIRMYRELWDRINTKRGYGWDTNPWVFVIEFKRVNQEATE